MNRTLWQYRVDPYKIFEYIVENPRIPKADIARKFNVNPKTGTLWWDAAISKQIIKLPIFRRKSYLNFREYFYFLNVEDPHELYEEMQSCTDGIIFYSVQTGFSNFQVVTTKKMTLPGDTVLSGERSDYSVSIPPHCSFDTSLSLIREKLSNLDTFNYTSSPLVYHDEIYEWDNLSEQIYQKLYNNMRRPIRELLRTTDAYSDKIIEWIRTRENFGHTIVMYFPEGLSAYQPITYCIDTACEYDSLLIDLFSCFPVSTVFYRLHDILVISTFLPFVLEWKKITRKILSFLRKKELVGKYTNSIDEYYFSPDI